MTSPFRRVRHALILKGKTRRYLKYAIGEIFLVMVGILLALQVDNWNDHRLLQQNEQILVNQLVIDAMADSVYFEDRAAKLDGQMRTYNKLHSICAGEASELVSRALITEFEHPFIQLGGQSHLIKNNPDVFEKILDRNLKLELQNYARIYEGVLVGLDIYNEKIDTYATPIRIKYYRDIPDFYAEYTFADFAFLCEDEENLGVIELLISYGRNAHKHTTRFLETNQAFLKILRDFTG